MRILVTAASKHGSTNEIAKVIGADLERRGLEVTVAAVRDVGSIEDYDAVVLGSAVYLGRWMRSAKEFVTRHASVLSRMPVWLFSSGPVGSAVARPDPGDRRQGDDVAKAIGARDHRLFGGKLDRSTLSVIERAPVRVAKISYGDFRQWDEIRAWAAEIAEGLRPAAGSLPTVRSA